MSARPKPRRWELHLADLDPARGGEQRGRRPVLVVSNDGFNRHFPVVTVLPLTSHVGKTRSVYAFEALLPAGAAGNDVDSIVMPHQIRTISVSRLRARIGTLRSRALRAEIEDRIRDHLGIGPGDPSGA